jgi:hypothetical protein
MKEKTIKAIISKKFKDWTDSIEDTIVKDSVAKSAIITGGCIVSLLQNEQPHDYDVYFRDKATAKLVAEYYCKQWVEAHGETKNHIGRPEVPFVLDGTDVEAWKRGEKKLSEIAKNYTGNFNWKELDEEEQTRISHMITNTPADRIKIIFPSDGILEEERAKQDIDEYMESIDDLSEMDADSLEKEHSDEESGKEKYRPVFMSTNAITLSDKIQIIIRFYGEPEQIHSTYDFVHATCYWDSKNGSLNVSKEALMAIMNKDLFYRGSKYPLASIIRTRKFLKRGWNINAGQYLKMCFQVSELDLTDIDILEDQLVGVDSLYFIHVVNTLRAMKEKNPKWEFDSTYLASVIDKIF